MTNTDDELLSETDIENVARMERMLRERGYLRHLGGFWIDAAGSKGRAAGCCD